MSSPAPKMQVAFKIVASNETPAAKMHRLATAQFREFVKEYPEEAVRMVRELAPRTVKRLLTTTTS